MKKKSTVISRYSLISIMVLLVMSIGCRKFVELEPPKTQIVTEAVFSDDQTAKSALAGLYIQMSDITQAYNGSVSSLAHVTGLSADEFVNLASHEAFEQNDLLETNSTVKLLWDDSYRLIYYANSILEGISNSDKITAPLRKQLEGEAKFIRAFCNFYLVNVFGDIPLATTTDYRVNNTLSRSSVQQAYDLIVADLIQAQNLLLDDYSISNNERVRPNKWAATALLARIYLYRGEWANAEASATSVLSNTVLFTLLSNLNDVFLKGSKEAIWQLMPRATFNTREAELFIPFNPIPSYLKLSTYLLNSFEVGDMRKTEWIKSITSGSTIYYHPFKYKVRGATTVTQEYSIRLRLSEQYLIRAEARAQLNNISGAVADLNVLRTRARATPTVAVPNPLPNLLTSLTQPQVLAAVEQERRVELFSEWCHRWFDLKRTNRTDAVLGPIKTPNWQPTDVLYPIPRADRANNPNLTQNAGY